MKVKCINNVYGGCVYYLTIGEVYEVISSKSYDYGSTYYKIKNNKGKVADYRSTLFVMVDEKTVIAKDENKSVTINTDGTVSIKMEYQLQFDDAQMKKIIKTIVTNYDEYEGEDAHYRWSLLYNAYDLYMGGDIRKEHFEARFPSIKTSRIDYIADIGKLADLFYIACKLYKAESKLVLNDYEVTKC
jgi:hypothetical protein